MLDDSARERHLLVVDDDDRIRALLKEYLARAGFRVTGAAGAAQARRIMATLDFDLAVLDVMMPGEDGLALTRWLRERGGSAGRTPILMLTARGLPEDRIEGLKTGADDYLPKPFEPEELLLRIEAPRTVRSRAARSRWAVAASTSSAASWSARASACGSPKPRSDFCAGWRAARTKPSTGWSWLAKPSTRPAARSMCR
jgi:two-component system phosphate regulon response regulator OmpR